MAGRYPATAFGFSNPYVCYAKGLIMLIPPRPPATTTFFGALLQRWSKSCVVHAAHEWICAFQSPPHSLHQNVSRSPSGGRSGISFLSGWQLWNTSLCLSRLACNLPSNFGIHSNYAALYTLQWWLSVTAAIESPNTDGSFCPIRSNFLVLLALIWPSFSNSVWLLFSLPRDTGASIQDQTKDPTNVISCLYQVLQKKMKLPFGRLVIKYAFTGEFSETTNSSI